MHYSKSILKNEWYLFENVVVNFEILLNKLYPEPESQFFYVKNWVFYPHRKKWSAENGYSKMSDNYLKNS